MAGIYNRDNIGSMLMTGLENALRRRNERTKTENARTADSIKAINSFVKSAGYASQDDLDDKLNQLKLERLAAQKAQEDANQAVLDANERSLVAEQNMDGYKPGVVGSAYEQLMQGYMPSIPTRQPVIPVVHQAYMYTEPERPQPNYNYWDAMQGVYRRNR